MFTGAKLVDEGGGKNAVRITFEYDGKLMHDIIALKEHTTFHNGSSYAKALLKASPLLIHSNSFNLEFYQSV